MPENFRFPAKTCRFNPIAARLTPADRRALAGVPGDTGAHGAHFHRPSRPTVSAFYPVLWCIYCDCSLSPAKRARQYNPLLGALLLRLSVAQQGASD
ncbi:hypothetical protein HMPREF0262_01167 [Clostridium sp. ATCC 29733]|nr:hypothetical protein HMPREF0262_01167 [Clostridium sp. ATCC 29733]